MKEQKKKILQALKYVKYCTSSKSSSCSKRCFTLSVTEVCCLMTTRRDKNDDRDVINLYTEELYTLGT